MKRYRKSYRTVKKRVPFRIFKHKITWIVLLVVAFITSLVYLFIFSSVFQVKNIDISETEKVPTEEINNIISDNIGNIFLANLKDISQKIIDRFPQIDNVVIKRKLPDKLITKIVERQPIAIFCKPSIDSSLKIFGTRENKDCYYIDNKGIVFEEAGEKDLPIIKIQNPVYRPIFGREVIGNEYLKKLLTINYDIKDIGVSELYPVSENRLDVKTSENWNIYFNTKGNIDWQVEKLNVLLKEKLPVEERTNLEYIDLRFDKIYFKKSS